MKVRELIEQLNALPNHDIEVRMSIKGAEVDITNVDWIVPSGGKAYALLDDYDYGT